MKTAGAAVLRVLDANLNRLTEGLKVVEDIVRFGLDEPGLLRSVRAVRTRVGRDTRALRRRAIAGRASATDPGRGDRFDRTSRDNLDDVLAANFKRAEEAARVLEETLKVIDPKRAPILKQVRFRLYDLEKSALAAAGRAGLDQQP